MVTSPRASAQDPEAPPLWWATDRVHEWLKWISQQLDSAFEGKLRSVGSVTLTANDTTTTISDKRIGTESKILLQATTANAAAVVSTTYISAKAKDSATITHASDADTDQTFDYFIVGT